MDLSEKYNILQAAMAASERVFKLLDTESTIVSPPNPNPGNGAGSVEFRNVWGSPMTQQRHNGQRGERKKSDNAFATSTPTSSGSSAASRSPSPPAKLPPS